MNFDDKKELYIAIAFVVGAGLLILLHRNTATATASSVGDNALQGGFTTASTVFVPTSSYDLHYETNNGTIIYNTNSNGIPSVTTTAPAPTPINPAPAPTPAPAPAPVTTTSTNHTVQANLNAVNDPTKYGLPNLGTVTTASGAKAVATLTPAQGAAIDKMKGTTDPTKIVSGFDTNGVWHDNLQY